MAAATLSQTPGSRLGGVRGVSMEESTEKLMLAFLGCNHISHLPIAAGKTPLSPVLGFWGSVSAVSRDSEKSQLTLTAHSAVGPIPATEGLRGLHVP